MKLLDKLKDLFTDDVEISEENDISTNKTEEKNVVDKKLPTVMLMEQKKEEIKNNNLGESIISDRELFKENNNFNSNNDNFRFPIAFEEKDFAEEKIYSRQNVMRIEQEKPKIKEKESYIKPKKEEKIALFKASPVISPVYGILDKNYKKEEVHAKEKNSYEINRTPKTVDFESVRKKAFGNLTDDIKDNLSDSKKNKIEHFDHEELLQDMTLDNEVKEITLGDAEENYFDFGVAYENAKKNEKQTDNQLNNSSEVKIVSYVKEEPIVEKIEVNEPVIDTSKQDDFDEPNKNVSTESITQGNLELSDDIFNLIDNMYQESGDE